MNFARAVLSSTVIILVLYGSVNMSFAKNHCLDNPGHEIEALSCYLKQAEPSQWRLLSTHEDAAHDVNIHEYELTSIVWPTESGEPWKHQLIIYQPKQVTSQQALLFIGKGTNKPAASWVSTETKPFDLVQIAQKSNTVVAELTNVPNQCITFEDGTCYQGDGLIAITWLKYLKDPHNENSLPAHFMMVKNSVIAMNAMQSIMAEHNIEINKFTIAGKSKRGWAAWLVALHDERVNSIIAIVADFLDTQSTIQHIKDVYGNYPIAMSPFIKTGVIDYAGTPEFAALMQMEDPLAYLAEPRFVERLSIPKLIISSSGDDFTVPDTVTRYYDRIPGQNSIHMIPNNPHYVSDELSRQLIESYYVWLLKGYDVPTIQWQFDAKHATLTINTDQQPKSIELWRAVNSKSQDFRYSSKVHYEKVPLDHLNAPIKLQRPEKGWSSQFVSMQFENKAGDSIVLTTPGFVFSNS